MSQSEQDSAGTVVDDATAAANADIRDALDGVGGTDDPATHAHPSDERVAAASGAQIGHGTIRLRSQPSPRLVDTAPGVTAPEAAATREPVGHGTIRLLTAPAEEAAPAAPEAIAPPAPEPAAPPAAASAPAPEGAQPSAPEPYAAPETAAAPEPVGHGPIRFIQRSLELPPTATDEAEAEIFAVLSAG